MQFNKRPIKPVLSFVGHSFAGFFAFGAVYSIAVILSFLVERLEDFHCDPITITILTYLHFALEGADAIVFLVYIGVTGIEAVHGMLKRDEEKP
ncbi:MAG: hypothetical protein F8N36_14300 [Desulfovibrio sp.]|uniref:hypothetical protein n=1 Tax=Desulfovibrio sp. TaxID=885 RepID=UPI00135EEDD2|nr:hypothetical protein [Desulfovibrio sp.]MTJ94009.1 hypothetical protein [Desulfovibrio sp.]